MLQNIIDNMSTRNVSFQKGYISHFHCYQSILLRGERPVSCKQPVVPVQTSSASYPLKRRVKGLAHTIVQELCESRGGCPELSVLTSLLVSVDVKNY